MAGYTKLFSSIVTSTIWCEDDATRIIWITMVAIAGPDGLVDATLPGIANLSRVSIEKTAEAIEKFLSPDPYSRDKEFEGRRIERVGGIFRLLNYDKYRFRGSPDHRRAVDAARQRRHRAIKAQENGNVVTDGHDLSRDSHTMSHQAEAEAEAEAEAKETNQNHTPCPAKSKTSKQVLTASMIPEDLQTHQDAILAWLNYKRERGQGYKGEAGLRALWDRLRAIGPERIKYSIENSMANNWSGIFERNNPSNSKPTPSTNHKNAADVLRRLHENPFGEAK